eukprot:1036740-Pyramimonas_sp.AAC.1
MGEGYYEAENTRLSNVTISDNRLLANAVRYLIEPVAGPKSIWPQRGFVAGRNALANLVDIEEAMATCACTSDEGGLARLARPVLLVLALPHRVLHSIGLCPARGLR